MKMNLTPFWNIMSQEERLNYHKVLGERLLEHRYRYYILDHPVLSDSEYDHLERYYTAVSNTLEIKDSAADMVGFDLNRQDTQEAKQRVDSGIDFHSLWEKEMKEVWSKIGRPKNYEILSSHKNRQIDS